MATTNPSGRREQKLQARLDVQKKAARSQRIRRFALIGSGLAAVVVVIVLIVMNSNRPPDSTGAIHLDDPVTARGGLYQHIPEGSPTNYVHHPPSFGDHYPAPKDWGIYDSPVPEGYFVHNMEHGGVVLLYHCPSGCPETVTQLKTLVPQLPKEQFGEIKVVLSPYEQDAHLITVLAWDWELDLDAFDANQIRKFYQEHVDKAPERVM